ncbi:MAG TPA: ABC transporter substrate-binding protein [Acidimicrobiales bacterium]|nr:ABC transporter substrate-binding protein [Acidimicrobiales bacterium]
MNGAEPILVGVLTEHEGGATVEGVRRVVDEAVASGRLDRRVEFVVEQANGLPRGTAAAIVAAFDRLEAKGVLAILGPAITDNGLVARDLADRAEVPCLNWTGSDRTRSEWMFHYQIGSLEEEPFLLAAHLVERGLVRVAIVEDRSPIGRRYGEFFEAAADREGIDRAVKVLISPVADHLDHVVPVLRRVEPDAVVYLGLGLSARALGLALAAAGWRPPVVTNSALMFGHANPDWRTEWDGWTYVDAYDEDNPVLAELLAREGSGPVGAMALAGGHDMGRLLVEALADAEPLTRRGVKEAFERVKCLPAALGTAGTTVSFGQWDRAALKGGFIVLRRWQDGVSVRVPLPGTSGPPPERGG